MSKAQAADEQHQQDNETWQARLQQATVRPPEKNWYYSTKQDKMA